MDTIDLGVAAVRGLLERTGVRPDEVDSVVWGGVILPSGSAGIGREIVLDSELPAKVEATTVTRACTSGLVAITQAVSAVERGEADIVIAGGSDSTSNAEVKLPQSFVHKTAPVLMSSKSGVLDYFRLLRRVSIRRDLIPQRPSIRERTTGELMGESAERMAEENGISRERQDAFAAQSHTRASRAIAEGRFDDEIVSVDTREGTTVGKDDVVRSDSTAEKLAKLRPAFAENGTLTAGNSSALTDGAAAVLIMSEEKARSLGLTPRAAFRSWSYDAVDPTDQLLIGPALSIPNALKRAGMTLDDVDVVDIHEAFAAQILSVLKAIGSEEFPRERMGLVEPIGDLKPEEINLHGGSIALGHPFAATGARMVTTMANELATTSKNTAVLGICGAGGLSAAAILEAVS